MPLDLITAVESGKVGEVTILLKLPRTDVNIRGLFDKTALMYAAENGYIEIAKLLIEHGADVNSLNIHNKTALMYAAENGCIEIVKLLIEHGADVNIISNYGWKAFVYAISEKHIEITKLLLSYTVDINIIDKRFKTALMIASDKHCFEIRKILTNFVDIDNNLIKYVESGDLINIKTLLNYGTDSIYKNIYNKYFKTALMIASEKEYLDIVKILIEKKEGTDTKKEEQINSLLDNLTNKDILIQKLLDDLENKKEKINSLSNDLGNKDILIQRLLDDLKRKDNINRPKSKKTYFEILGINEDATFKEIKKAYFELSQKYHPDKVNHLGEEFLKMAHEKFKEITTI